MEQIGRAATGPSVMDEREYARSHMVVRPASAPPPAVTAEPLVTPSPDFGLRPLPWSGNRRVLGKPLSEREIELLELIRDGATNKQAAGALEISEQTVKNHMSSILAKLGAPDRTAAVVIGFRMGLFQIAGLVAPGVDPIAQLCDQIAARLNEIDGLTHRLQSRIADLRAGGLPSSQPEPQADLTPLAEVCRVRNCTEPPAEYTGRGRRPTKRERHSVRRAAA